MCSRVLAAGFALLLICSASVVSAQTPFIAVYFDANYTQVQKDCPPGPAGTVFDQFYVVLVNANRFVSGAEYRIQFGAAVMWLAATGLPPVALGTSPTGIALGFPVPQNGFFPVQLQTLQVLWMCDGCNMLNDPIDVRANPNTGGTAPQWTDWPGFNIYKAVGLSSSICATVATEETTWGQVKSIYGAE